MLSLFQKGRKQPARARSTMEPFVAAQGLVIVLQRSHARAYDDPLNKPNVQTTKNLRENKSTGAELPSLLPPAPPPSVPPPRYIATTDSTARNVSSLPAPSTSTSSPTRFGYPAGRRVLCPVPASAAGRMSLFRRLFYRRPPDGHGLVEISGNILGAFAFLAQYSVILLF